MRFLDLGQEPTALAGLVRMHWAKPKARASGSRAELRSVTCFRQQCRLADAGQLLSHEHIHDAARTEHGLQYDSSRMGLDHSPDDGRFLPVAVSA